MIWLSKAADLLNKVARPTSGVFHSVGAFVLVLMMMLTAADVILRKTMNLPIVGSYDLIVYMMAIVVAFGLAYCAVMQGHVKVDLVVEHFPRRVRAIIDSITAFLSMGLFSLITWQCFVQMKQLFASNVTSMVLLIPAFPFVGMVGAGSALLTLVLLAYFFDFLSQAVRK